MQTRPYDDQDGRKIWLSRSEAQTLLSIVQTDTPKLLAMKLGLHGLRSEEIVAVSADDLRPLDGASGHVLEVDTAKKHGMLPREPPISEALATDIMRHRSSAGIRIDEPLIDRAKRTVREWMEDARVELAGRLDDDTAHDLSLHDLRRTWATDAYYSLAFNGVPNAEQLVMTWGGWEQTSTGRSTFRQDYLGPVPDHVTERAVEHLALV